MSIISHLSLWVTDDLAHDLTGESTGVRISSMTTLATAGRKTARVKKAVSSSIPDSSATSRSPTPSLSIHPTLEAFQALLDKISQAKDDFEKFQKEIVEAKESWTREKEKYQYEETEKTSAVELSRKREEETYQYEANLRRKKEEDEFTERKEKWEKELALRKEETVREKKELEELRRAAAGFEEDKSKAVKEAELSLQKELTTRFDVEKKLREQEHKSEKEILSLKIGSLTQETLRQAKEITDLKRMLDEVSRQFKDIAVKVIESGSPSKVLPREDQDKED